MTKLLLLTLLMSCGQLQTIDYKTTDESFRGYINTFESFHGRVYSPIVFIADLGKNKEGSSIAGVCKTTGNYSEINIDETEWLKYNELQREMLVMHELGHCELNLDDNSTIVGGCPISIMNDSVFSKSEIEACYKNRRERLIRDIGNE